MVKEEQAARNKTAANKKPEEKASSSSDERDKPEIAIPQSIRSLDRLEVHPVSYCGENGAWDGWESMTRTDQRCGPNGKVEYLLSQGISVLKDDTAEILQEALIKGIRVYPLTTPHEKHVWNKGKKPAGATFCQLLHPG